VESVVRDIWFCVNKTAVLLAYWSVGVLILNQEEKM